MCVTEREEKLKRFLEEVEKENYIEAVKYFRELDLDSEYSIDNNYYLYLLGQIIDLDEYRERLYSLRFEDMSSYDLNDLEERARYLVFKHKFSQASTVYEILDDSDLELQVSSELVRKVAFELVKLNTVSLNYIRKARYGDLISLYSNISKHRPLSHFEKVVLCITKDLKDLVEKNKLPEVMLGPVRDSDDSVLLKDYVTAFNTTTKKGDKNLVYVLLKTMANKIEDRGIDLNSIVDSICEDEVSQIRHKVLCYLNNIGCQKYVRFINDLITIGMCDSDNSYSLVVTSLSLINENRENTLFDVSCYYDLFYEAISEGNIMKAKVYLDIVSQSRILSNRYVDVFPMKRELSRAMKVFSEEKTDDKYALLSDVVSDINESHGLRVLEELSEEDKHGVIDIVSKFPTIMIDEVDGRLVLRYHDIFSSCPEFYSLKLQGREAFINRDFDTTIECYNKVCTKLMVPSLDVYYKLGMAYLRRNKSEDDYKRAIDYLWVARGKGKIIDDKINMALKKVNYTGEKVIQYTKK